MEFVCATHMESAMGMLNFPWKLHHRERYAKYKMLFDVIELFLISFLKEKQKKLRGNSILSKGIFSIVLPVILAYKQCIKWQVLCVKENFHGKHFSHSLTIENFHQIEFCHHAHRRKIFFNCRPKHRLCRSLAFNFKSEFGRRKSIPKSNPEALLQCSPQFRSVARCRWF